MSGDRVHLNDTATLTFHFGHFGFWRIHYRNRIFLMLDSADDGICFAWLGEVVNVLRSDVVGADLVALQVIERTGIRRTEVFQHIELWVSDFITDFLGRELILIEDLVIPEFVGRTDHRDIVRIIGVVVMLDVFLIRILGLAVLNE